MIGSIWSRSALNTLRVSADLAPPDTWIHMVGFAAVMAGAVNVIIDLEYPRMGLIRVDTFDQALVDLRAGMN